MTPPRLYAPPEDPIRTRASLITVNPGQLYTVPRSTQESHTSIDAASPGPLSTPPKDTTEPCEFIKLNPYKQGWFGKLLVLMFGMAMGKAADLLYGFPYQPANEVGSMNAIWADPHYASLTILGYLIWILFDISTLILYVAASLILQESERARSLRECVFLLRSKRCILRQLLWISPVLALLAASEVFNWYYVSASFQLL